MRTLFFSVEFIFVFRGTFLWNVRRLGLPLFLQIIKNIFSNNFLYLGYTEIVFSKYARLCIWLALHINKHICNIYFNWTNSPFCHNITYNNYKNFSKWLLEHTQQKCTVLKYIYKNINNNDKELSFFSRCYTNLSSQLRYFMRSRLSFYYRWSFGWLCLWLVL